VTKFGIYDNASSPGINSNGSSDEADRADEGQQQKWKRQLNCLVFNPSFSSRPGVPSIIRAWSHGN